MTKRRQALRSRESLATLFFLSLILTISFVLPSIVLRAEPVSSEKSKSRPDGQGVASVDMPVNLPDGWVYDKVFGPAGGQHKMKATVLKSPNDNLRIAVLALVLTLLSAVSLIVWRHHRRDHASPRRIGRRI